MFRAKLAKDAKVGVENRSRFNGSDKKGENLALNRRAAPVEL
jgi:hypothetical protein